MHDIRSGAFVTDALRDKIVAAVSHQYEIENEIGRGGMSVVYRARDVRLNRTVAIKVLPPELAYDQSVRARFTREAQTAAHLTHPHIVPIYDVGEHEGLAYLVMAFVTGGNLAALLAHEPRQPVGEVKRLVCEIADALAYAHGRGVIHRDIKPDNILLDRDTGRAQVTDFGIARAMEGNTRLTATGNAIGTPAYMSPEQAVGEREVDGRSDIYSLGVLAYQMLTGRTPFTAGNSMALLLKHVGERPRPVAELRPETPRPLRDVIERALMKDPEDRWPTAGALKEALTTGEVPAANWRSDPREPVRYVSPQKGVPAVAPAPVAATATAKGGREIVMEPPHLAALSEEQRDDLRLWHGRVNLYDRIRAMRGYAVLTVVSVFAGFGALGGVEDIPPLIIGPAFPVYMSIKLWRRGKSLRRAGLRLRRVLLMPLARWVIPKPPPPPSEAQLQKLAPKDVLESPHGAAIRRAAEDRAAILDIVASLPKADRTALPDIVPTVHALVDRVATIAQQIMRLEQSVDPRLAQELDAKIGEVGREADSPDNQRRLALLKRQRGTLEELSQRRSALARQLESAGIALRNLRLDLIKLRSSGLQSALSDVSSATQEARALSRDISMVLDAADEVRSI